MSPRPRHSSIALGPMHSLLPSSFHKDSLGTNHEPDLELETQNRKTQIRPHLEGETGA